MFSSLTTTHPFRPFKPNLQPRNSSTRNRKSNKKTKNPQKALTQTTHSKRNPSPRKTPVKQQRKARSQKGKEKMFMTSSLNLPRMGSVSYSESFALSSQQFTSNEQSMSCLPWAELLTRTKNTLRSYEHTNSQLRNRNKQMERQLAQARQRIGQLERQASLRRSREL